MKNLNWQFLLYIVCILPISIILIFFGCMGLSDFLYMGIAAISTCGIALLLLIINLIVINKREDTIKRAILSTGISQVDNLDPFEFEAWVAMFLRSAGHNATPTKKAGDYGVDVIAEKGETRVAIQVKKFSQPVGIRAVQEVISGMDYYDCNYGCVITTAPYFTQAAKNLAEKRKIKLYTKNDLAIMLYELQKNKDIDVLFDLENKL